MTAAKRLTPLSDDEARREAAPLDARAIRQLQEDGEIILRDLQAQARQMRTLSADDLKVRSR